VGVARLRVRPSKEGSVGARAFSAGGLTVSSQVRKQRETRALL
jgi:hypothetical protein